MEKEVELNNAKTEEERQALNAELVHLQQIEKSRKDRAEKARSGGRGM